MTPEPNTHGNPTGRSAPPPAAQPPAAQPPLPPPPGAPAVAAPIPQHAPPPPARGSGSAAFLVSVGVVAGLFVGVGGTLLVGSLDLSGSPFPGAVESCGLRNRPTADIGDEGRSLDLDNRGQTDPAGITVADLLCVLDELEAPDSVISEMEQTRALDGRQSAGWDGIEASWSYHPDTGLDVLLTLR